LNNVFRDVTSKKIVIGYSPAGRSVLGKTVPAGLGYSRYLGTQDRGHSFSNTDQPRLVNNILFFSTTE